MRCSETVDSSIERLSLTWLGENKVFYVRLLTMALLVSD